MDKLGETYNPLARDIARPPAVVVGRARVSARLALLGRRLATTGGGSGQSGEGSDGDGDELHLGSGLCWFVLVAGCFVKELLTCAC